MPKNISRPPNIQNNAADIQIIPIVRSELQKLLSKLDELDPDNRKTVAVQALESLDTKDKKEAIRQASGVGSPDQSVTNFVWKMIVTSLAIVLVGSFLFLAFAVVFLQKTSTDAGLQMLLEMFTLVVGFLVGLLAPSPIHK